MTEKLNGYREVLESVGMPGIKNIDIDGCFEYNDNTGAKRGVWGDLKGQIINGGIVYIETTANVFSSSKYKCLKIRNVDNYSFYLRLRKNENANLLFDEVISSIKNDSFYDYVGELKDGVLVYHNEKEIDMKNKLKNMSIVNVEFKNEFGEFTGSSECGDFCYNGLIDEKGYFYLEEDLVENTVCIKGDYDGNTFNIELELESDIRQLYEYFIEGARGDKFTMTLLTIPKELCVKLNIIPNKTLIR